MTEPLWLGQLKRTRSAVLLLSLVLLMMAHPLALDHPSLDELFSLTAVMVLLAALYAISQERRHVVIGLCLLTASTLLELGSRALHWAYLDVLGLVAGFLFYAYAIIVLLGETLRAHRVTADVICASVSVYLLFGVAFAILYLLADMVAPGALGGSMSGAQVKPERRAIDFIFFSMMTLTTVGYGDIVPVSHQARALAMLEATVGVMYPAILVGSLINIYSSYRGAPEGRGAGTPDRT